MLALQLNDEVERLGVQRARQEMERADVLLVIVEAAATPTPAP